jgi:hypothetical protein
MSKKSVVTEAHEIQLAIELIQLGARLQLLETEVSLSRERLLKLYKEQTSILRCSSTFINSWSTMPARRGLKR